MHVIAYPGCKEFYIKGTINLLQARVRVHKQHTCIKSPKHRQIPLSEHLDVYGENSLIYFQFTSLRVDTSRNVKSKNFL